jgi:hypothetical protein
MAESKDTTLYNINNDPDADAKIKFLAGYVNDPKNKTDLTQTDPKSKKTDTSNGGKRKSRRNRKSRQNRKKKSRQSRRR